MHGLICKAIEEFVSDQHGSQAWAEVRVAAQLPFEHFESLRTYDQALAERVFNVAAASLRLDRSALFEDVGAWVCTHPRLEAVRRLIRFTGRTFVDLLYALDEMHDRACMAVPGLNLPRYRLDREGEGEFEIHSRWRIGGGAAVLTGVLRAMADDYGTLALIDAGEVRFANGLWHERIHVRVVDHAYQAPREFMLGGVT